MPVQPILPRRISKPPAIDHHVYWLGNDHVFGIPLVDVVENDQLLRLQKSAAFATTLDFSVSAEGGSVNEETPTQQQLGGSCSSSCSGSVTSINQQALHAAAETPCIHKCIQK